MRYNISPLKAIFLTATTLILLLLISIIIIVTYPDYAYQKTEIKAPIYRANVYSDKESSGNSVAKPLEEPDFHGFDCEIKKGFEYPYCISQIILSNSSTIGDDLSQFEEIKIYGYYSAPSPNDFLRVSLLNYNSNYSNTLRPETNKYNSIEYQARTLTFPISVKLKQLSVPNWWISLMKDKNVDMQLELDNIIFLEVGTGTGSSLGEHQLQIHKIELIKNTFPISQLYKNVLIAWGGIITLLIISIILYLIISLKNAKIKTQRLVAVNEMLSVKPTELEAFSDYDALTGLLNRTGLKAKMVECVDNQCFPLTVAMIDIDFFQEVNDNCGHQQGDLFLEQVGSLLKSFIYLGESAARFDGEEFILLFPKQDMANILDRLEVLRVEISEMDSNIKQPITASFGVATAQQYSEFTQLLEIADTALYKAKQDGRNCIRVSV